MYDPKECSVKNCKFYENGSKNKLFKKPTSYKSMSECLEWNLTLYEVRFIEVNKLLKKFTICLKNISR